MPTSDNCQLKTPRPTSGVVGALALVMALLGGCEQASETTSQTTPPLRPVKTLHLTAPDSEGWREFPGVVDAGQKAELGFQSGGRLEKLLSKEGDLVESGQLLAQLDTTDHQIQLKSRQAEYAQVHEDFSRAQTLVARGVISRSDFNKLQAQNATAEANLAAARQHLKTAYLRAPFAGRIARRYVENHEEVSALQSIYLLQDITSLTVKVAVPESLMIKVRQGAKPDVIAMFDGLPDQRFPLSLKEKATQANADTNTFEVTFDLAGTEGLNILPGMSVTVRGRPTREHQAGQLFLPPHAVLEDRGGRFVYQIKAEGDIGVVERQPVEVGALSSQGLAITGGLAVGDEIVVAGMSKMFPGLKVRISEGNR